MKNIKKIIALMLVLILTVGAGSMSFASDRTKISSRFLFNYWYREYIRDDGGYEWSVRIPNHSPIYDIKGRPNSALGFKSEMLRFEENYRKFKKEAYPSSSLKQSDPEEYKNQYRRYKIMYSVIHDLMKKCDGDVLGDAEDFRTAFYEYKDKHYPGSYKYHFYGDDVDYLLDAGDAVSGMIIFYNQLK